MLKKYTEVANAARNQIRASNYLYHSQQAMQWWIRLVVTSKVSCNNNRVAAQLLAAAVHNHYKLFGVMRLTAAPLQGGDDAAFEGT